MTDEDFYKESHKKIFRVICKLCEGNEPIDLVTVANALQKRGELDSLGGAQFLADISDKAQIGGNAVGYANTIRKKSLLRQFLRFSMELSIRCLDKEQAFSDVVAFAEHSVSNIAGKYTGEAQSLCELNNLNIDKLDEQHGKDECLAGMSTGYPRLNNITSGLHGSDLIILAARPSMGKTALALNIVRNVALEEKRIILIFSLDLSAEQMSFRFLTSGARIDSNRLSTSCISKEDWGNTIDEAVILNELPIFVDDTPNIKVKAIRTKARKLKRKYGGLDLIVIDYIQLMKPPVRYADRKDLEIAEITSGLKCLAKEMDIPIIALSQLSRNLELRGDKRPMLSDLSDSGALEQDANMVMFIYRDEIYHKKLDNPQKGTAEIIVAKNDKGPLGTVLMHFHQQYSRFEELVPLDFEEMI